MGHGVRPIIHGIQVIREVLNEEINSAELLGGREYKIIPRNAAAGAGIGWAECGFHSGPGERLLGRDHHLRVNVLQIWAAGRDLWQCHRSAG